MNGVTRRNVLKAGAVLPLIGLVPAAKAAPAAKPLAAAVEPVVASICGGSDVSLIMAFKRIDVAFDHTFKDVGVNPKRRRELLVNFNHAICDQWTAIHKAREFENAELDSMDPRREQFERLGPEFETERQEEFVSWLIGRIKDLRNAPDTIAKLTGDTPIPMPEGVS